MLALGLNLSPRAHGGGSSSGGLPLRTVATQNRVFQSYQSRAGKQNVVQRWPFVLGSDTPKLIGSFNNWINNGGDSLSGNSITIIDASLEAEADHTVVPITFNGGDRSLTLDDGDYDVHSDAVLPADFDLDKFSRGEQYWFKCRMSVPVDGNKVPNSIWDTSSFSGTQVAFYNPANTTVTSTDVAGKYTATGTALDAQFSGFMPMWLGYPALTDPSYLFNGNSIGEGFGDSGLSGVTPSGVSGFGMFQRATHDADLTSNPIASINLCKGGAQTKHVLGDNIRSQAFFKYCRFMLEEYGTNDIRSGGDSEATVKNSLTTLWNLAKANGVEKIVRTQYLPYTTSTNNWTAADDQTEVSTSWTDATLDLNDWFADQVTAGVLAGVVDLTALRDATNPRVWLTNGTAKAYTGDGLHPSHLAAETAAVAIRALTESLGMRY
jgi:lysophospholipase L1-like esterase